MLVNIDNVLPIVIQSMQNLRHEFFLTGSRFFNNETDNSKIWEFFVQDSIEIVDWLINNDFKLQDQTVLAGATHSYRFSDVDLGLVIYISTVKSKRTMNRLHQIVKKLNPAGFKTEQALQMAQQHAFAMYLEFNTNGQTE